MNEPALTAATNAAASSRRSAKAPWSATLTICNRKGLHARASASFVQTVEKFDADVRVMRCGETVGGTSIMGLMMLAASPGTRSPSRRPAKQAAEVVDALATLIESRFGEDD